MKVAQAISRALVSEGVTLAAGIAGQSIWPVIDAIGDCEEISLMYARQERVAFDICDGFARASGNPAVVFTDAGPAAANLMGGIVNSWGDSVPVLFLAGHNDRTKIASKFTKELPFLEIFGPVSKWSAMIDDPSKVAETLRRAFMHMRTGRPGPVALGVPLDVAQMEVGNFEYLPVSPRPRVRSGADPDAIDAAHRSHRQRRAALCLCRRRRAVLGSDRRAGPLRRTSDAAGRDHAERQERVPGEPSAGARHRRLRPRVLRLAAGDRARPRAPTSSSPSAAASSSMPRWCGRASAPGTSRSMSTRPR